MTGPLRKSPYARMQQGSLATGVGWMEPLRREVTSSVDLGVRLRRTANVQDDVPRLFLRRIDAKRHLSPPFVVDGREDLAETLAILLRDVHDPEVQIELIARSE